MHVKPSFRLVDTFVLLGRAISVTPIRSYSVSISASNSSA